MLGYTLLCDNNTQEKTNNVLVHFLTHKTHYRTYISTEEVYP